MVRVEALMVVTTSRCPPRSKSEIVSAFNVFVDAHDIELSGLVQLNARRARCEDLHQPDAFREASFSRMGGAVYASY